MITPLDIENKKFSKQMMNGYSVDEVDDFLDELTIDYTKNYKEVNELRSKVDELNKSLEHYKAIEETLQNTLVMAQSTAEDVKKDVKDGMIKAEAKVHNIKEDIKEKAEKIHDKAKLKKEEIKDKMQKKKTA